MKSSKFPFEYLTRRLISSKGCFAKPVISVLLHVETTKSPSHPFSFASFNNNTWSSLVILNTPLTFTSAFL